MVKEKSAYFDSQVKLVGLTLSRSSKDETWTVRSSKVKNATYRSPVPKLGSFVVQPIDLMEF